MKANTFQNLKLIILKSIITCPECDFQKEEVMPENAYSFFYEWTNCHSVLKPEAGDCFVYCSYGKVHCPPIQKGKNCC